MSLGPAERKDLDAYIASAGIPSAECRAGSHNWPNITDLGHTPFVSVDTHRWRIVMDCTRHCLVAKWAKIDERTKQIDGKWHMDYSQATGYLRPSGVSGVTMGAAEKRYVQGQLITMALAQVRKRPRIG